MPAARGSGGARAPEGPGQYRDEQAFELLLRLVPELAADGRQHQPVQQYGSGARAEAQLRPLDAGNVCLHDLDSVGTNLIDPRCQWVPFLWRVDRGARDD